MGKSRNSIAGLISTMLFNQTLGFDPEVSLFVMLKNAGRIKGAGAYLYIDDHDDIKFSQKNFKDKLMESPERQQYFTEAVSEELMKIPMDIISDAPQTFSATSGILANINSMNFE